MKINEKQLAQVNDRIKALVSAGSFYEYYQRPFGRRV